MCVCIALCTIVAHNIAQNRPDNFPSYPPDNHHCYDDVYLREGGLSKYTATVRPKQMIYSGLLGTWFKGLVSQLAQDSK